MSDFLDTLMLLQAHLDAFHIHDAHYIIWEDVDETECAYVRQVVAERPQSTIVIRPTSDRHFNIFLEF